MSATSDLEIPMATTSRRPILRRDAAANRARLLDAAEEVFAVQGFDAGVEQIVRAAGVGMGTLYRRFPTKDALVSALVVELLERMIDVAEEAHAIPDGKGLEYFLQRSTVCQAMHPGCLPRLWDPDADGAAVRRLRSEVARLLADAKAHGRARPELTDTDITMVMWAMRGVVATTRDIAPGAWRRHLDIVLAGLRPAAAPLVHGPISRAQLDEVVRPN
jgi:AcrR family transcriptional regulator